MPAPLPQAEPPAPPAAPEPSPDSPEARELEWLRTVYAGDSQPQLTLRAVLMGSALGVVMAFSNIYVGLRMAWSLGVAITACVLSYAIFRVAPFDWLQAPRRWSLFDRHREREISILENNCLQSTASAAGFSTGTVLTSGFAAYVLVTGKHPPIWAAGALVFFVAALGVFLAIPLKRNLINVERLPFPSGTAAAETLRSLHAAGEEAARKARALFSAMGFGALLAWLRDGQPMLLERLGAQGFWSKLAVPGFVPLSDWFRRLGMERAGLLTDPAGYTLSLQISTLAAAAGAFIGVRVAASMLAGALLNYGLLVPLLHEQGVIGGLGYRAIAAWSVWGGVAVLTSAALVGFCWEWRTLRRGLLGLSRALRGRPVDDPLERIEVPASWFLWGVFLATLGCVLVNRYVFGVSVALGLLAVALTALMSMVACRATGETDVNPTGPLGKITQLVFGVLAPGSTVANLMSATTTAGASASAADLLIDLKAGHLLGANPRKQFLAQFFGVLVGTVAATAAFFILVPSASALGGDDFPAPAAQIWRAVAQLLSDGLAALPPYAGWAMAIGALLGSLLTIAERLFPKKQAFIPSAVGFGMAFTFHGFLSISFFLGAVAAALWARSRPKSADRYVVPVASGLIAGESVMGVTVALLKAVGVL